MYDEEFSREDVGRCKEKGREERERKRGREERERERVLQVFL